MGDRSLPRSERIARRLQTHVLVVPLGRVPARDRLEAEIGPELTRRLLGSLVDRRHSASPGPAAAWPSIATNSHR